MYAYGAGADRQSAQNNNNSQKIDRWTAERLLLLRGDNDNGNHLIDLNDAANSRIT